MSTPTRLRVRTTLDTEPNTNHDAERWSVEKDGTLDLYHDGSTTEGRLTTVRVATYSHGTWASVTLVQTEATE